MKLLLGLVVVVVTLGVLHSAPEDPPTGISEDTLKQLSVNGEKLVDEEVRRALYGVKQMREVMWRNGQKHEHLMKSLRHSSDKKKGADELAKEVTEKLEEAEEQCRDSLQSEWEQCRPCLEDACKTFYTSTCRRGFGTFHAKVENFFRKVSRRFGPREPRTEPGDILVNQGPDSSDTEVDRIEDSFNRLSSRVGLLVSRSVALVSSMSSRLDRALQTAFLNGTDSLAEDSTADPYNPSRDSGFLQGVGLEEVMESFFDFGKSVVEEFGAVVTQVFDDIHEAVEEEKKKVGRESFPRFLQNRKLCRDLRKQTSECWQLQDQCEVCQGALLTECPSVRELHVELDEVSQLLDVSKEQYDEILSIVQRHTDETVSWLSNMAAEVSWVAEAASNTSIPENIFRITKVAPKSHDEENKSVSETKVEVTVLNSPPLLLSVPGELMLQDPAFIQFVTQEALNKYKEMFRSEDE
ncbi:clusterin-like protein 1 [Centropristis striata]|uniref:clusterin-like protein 1 n=1 Tax=Centropristis striata TaxID=184440 RepID=UPI0027E1C45E|nr:clusterin-like protein 1 [Centropristis striata]